VVGMATTTEKINNIFSATSSSWGSKKEELEGRAAMHESQSRRYAAQVSNAFEGHTLSNEDAEAARIAAAKKKQQQDMEAIAFADAQTKEVAKPAPSLMLAARANKREPVAKLPGFLAVKKPRVGEPLAGKASPPKPANDGSTSGTQAVTGNIGLGDYSTSSEESAE